MPRKKKIVAESDTPRPEKLLVKKVHGRGKIEIRPCLECNQFHVIPNTERVSCAGHTKRQSADGPVPCHNAPVEGDVFCARHDGKALALASSEWKPTYYGERMPERLQDAFKRNAEDKNALSMRTQLALVDAREIELLKQLDTGESGEAWRNVKMAASELKRALEADDKVGMAKSTYALLLAVERGGTNEEVWAEIRVNAEYRRKLTETERKHIDAERANMSLDQIGQVATFLGGLLKRYVTDQARLAAAAEELARYFKGTMIAKSLPDPSVIEAEVLDA